MRAVLGCAVQTVTVRALAMAGITRGPAIEALFLRVFTPGSAALVREEGPAAAITREQAAVLFFINCGQVLTRLLRAVIGPLKPNDTTRKATAASKNQGNLRCIVNSVAPEPAVVGTLVAEALIAAAVVIQA